MPIITFWSEKTKETGQTKSAIAMATQMAIEHNHKILLLSTQYHDDDIESSFWDMSKDSKNRLSFLGGHKKVSLDSGFDGLAKATASNRLSPEIITNYTKIVFKERLEVLSTYKSNVEDYYKVRKMYFDIIQTASRYYDTVIVDLEKGMNDFNTKVLEASNIIVYGLNQNINSINSYIESKYEGFLKDRKNVIPFIGRFDGFSKYNVKNIARYISEGRKIEAISYNTLFMEACDEGKVADFFLKLKTIKSEDRNVDFANEVRSLSDAIKYRLQELQMKI